ncbi:MAG: helix-turn-helix domain-containing protein [Planctomycetes bacterium]|nr:helix-turn-helix domain-containing protein [Planctomycetota bacterium]
MSIEIGGVEVFSLEEVSQRLGVAPDALKRCMRRGELAARKIGDQWFITTANLLAFLATPSAPSKRTAKHPKVEEPPAALHADPPAAPPPAAPPAPPAPVADLPAPPADPRPATVIAKPETVLPHELPPAAVVPPPAPPAPPGTLPSEIKTELTLPVAPLPSHLMPPPEAKKDGEAVQALFALPLLPPDEPVLQAIEAPPAPVKEDLHAIAVEATRRRSMANAAVMEAPGATPGQSPTRRTLLDSEELPVPQVDAPGASQAPDTRHVIRAIEAPPPAPPVSRLSEIPDMFGPDSPTLLLTPEQVKADAERTKTALLQAIEHGRVAQRARDEIVGTVRRLPMEEQSFALAGPIGEQLVKLDRLIEEGVKAQRELGVAATPVVKNVITAVHKAPPAAPGVAPLDPPSSTPVEVKRPDESNWLPIEEKRAVADPVPLIENPPTAIEAKPAATRPPSRVAPPAGIGGETWHEVGLPSPPPGAGTGKEVPAGIVRLTLALTEDEKRVLSDHRIAEETAVQEIMRRYQPTDEKGWADAKGRFFNPLKGKGGVRAR